MSILHLYLFILYLQHPDITESNVTVYNIDHLATGQCSADKPWILRCVCQMT